MASLLSLSLLCLLFHSAAAGRGHRTTSQQPSPEIQQACTATRYPDVCRAQLPQPPAHSGPVQIILSALSVSAQNLKTGQSMVTDILASSAGNRNRTAAAETCLEVLSYSASRTDAAGDALSRDKLNDARAWASAALVYQYDCWSGLKYVNDTSKINETMSFLNGSLIVSTSNALSMIGALINYGVDTAAWAPPRTERSGFWEQGSASDSDLGFPGEFPTGLAADATVCKAGCDYEAVQKAVEAAPVNLEKGKRYVIHIKEGVYEEIVRVGFEKKNLVFVGDGVGKTVITGSLNAGIVGVGTYGSATVGVAGDGFMASGITFENAAPGPETHQAVAFRSDSDLSFLENCEFLGNQDTLYAHSLRQVYKSCRIEGNVDFIFGMGATLFQDCTILIRPRQQRPERGETNTITAHGRTDPAQSTGFTFLGCLVNGTEEYVKLYLSNPKAHRSYLGRPWKEFSRTVFIETELEALISPLGWSPWTDDFALKTLYYGEYKNTGPGADVAQRVPWSSRIPEEHVGVYSAKNFLQADEYPVGVSDKTFFCSSKF